ncbi:site-2 protease family protein [Rhodococcus sp. X156]|uniref:M50 family metallopeptidase n=1 Tax=Rhodococcus sp. X156 TaxID=2499145 RepID=UPI000FD887EE|nr:site-2 protease family protein [Rhodococcus sp. X156]
MVFAFGVVLFALGIGFSIALHEFGHLLIAKAFGMKVRRYFIGFGPRLFSFRRGETEYGFKAIPAGGFCDIAGMTALDELDPDEVDRAMYKQSAWKRIAVMLGGPISHFALGMVLIYVLAVGFGLPNLDATDKAVAGAVGCVAPTQSADGSYAECTGEGPAQRAGLQAGDTIVAVDGKPTPTFADVIAATQALTGPAPFTVERDGREVTLTIDVEPVQRYVVRPGDPEPQPATVGAIGVSPVSYAPTEHNAVSAIPGTVAFTGTMFEKTWESLLKFPEKVPAVVRSIGGEERSADTPISVVGASVIGGQVAERGLWEVFILLLASLNFFIGIFNLLPLLPLDGGHMAITTYEKVRDMVRRALGKAKAAPVDYTKMLPLTYVVLIIGGGVTVLTVIADVVNPIQLFP